MAKYWFAQKRFGYGATPNTWQGWLFMAGSMALIAAVVLAADFIRDNGLRALWLAGGFVLVLAPTIAIAYRKTEGGWRWRLGDDH